LHTLHYSNNPDVGMHLNIDSIHEFDAVDQDRTSTASRSRRPQNVRVVFARDDRRSRRVRTAR